MPIIAVSGYAGSGKDTVGKVIQLLNNPKVKAKDIPAILKKESILEKYCSEQEWEIKKFAGKLKIIASILTGIPLEKFEDQEFKKTFLDGMWSSWQVTQTDIRYPELKEIPLSSKPMYSQKEAQDFKEDYQTYLLSKTNSGYDISLHTKQVDMSVRDFLQILGTECMRSNLHKNVWVNALMADYVKSKEGNYPSWVITDARFENEAEAIKKRGGVIVRVNRKGVESVNRHASETSLDHWSFDYIIHNNKDIDHLVSQIVSLFETVPSM